MSYPMISQCGEFMRWAMFSSVPVRRLSMQTTLYPSERSLSQRWLPTKPAPPVTSTRFLRPPPEFLATAEALVANSGGPDLSRLISVATVHEELRGLHKGCCPLEIQSPHLLPLRHHYRRVCPRECLVWVEDYLQLRHKP